MAEQDEAPIDLASARAALDELFTLAKKYNGSDAYLELMRFVGRFRFYSPFNAMLIYTQMPGARFVCTPRKWLKDYRREIKTSARPIVILQPMGPVLFVFDVSDTSPLADAHPLPRQLEDPFRVRNGKIGGELGSRPSKTLGATECGSPSVPTVRSGPDRSNGPRPGSIWNLRSQQSRYQSRRRSLSGSSCC